MDQCSGRPSSISILRITPLFKPVLTLVESEPIQTRFVQSTVSIIESAIDLADPLVGVQ